MRIALNGLFLREPDSGTGQYLVNLLEELARGGDELVVVGPRGVSPDLPRGVRFIGLGASQGGENLGKVWFEQIVFPRACALLKAQVAHVPHWGSPLFPTIQTVVTVHDLIPIVLPAYRGGAGVRLYTRVAAASARRAKEVLVDSKHSGSDVERILRIGPNRIHVVPLAAASAFFPRKEEEQQAVLKRLNLPAKFILYLGGTDVRKNLRILLQAMRILNERGHDVPLVCAGPRHGTDNGFFPDPKRIAREEGLRPGTLILPGRVEEADKPALYSSATAFVFPSLYEGFGLPPLEAMACGVPVLVARASSLPEIVEEAGILLDPVDAGAWADGLASVLVDERLAADLRSRGRERAGLYSWSKTAQATRSIYEKAARQ